MGRRFKKTLSCISSATFPNSADQGSAGWMCCISICSVAEPAVKKEKSGTPAVGKKGNQCLILSQMWNVSYHSCCLCCSNWLIVSNMMNNEGKCILEIVMGNLQRVKQHLQGTGYKNKVSSEEPIVQISEESNSSCGFRACSCATEEESGLGEDRWGHHMPSHTCLTTD